MAKTTLSGLVMVVMLSLGAEPAILPAPPAPRSYGMTCKITKTDKQGEKKLFAEPRMTTLEGRPAKFFVGGQTAVTNGDGKVEFVEDGVSTEMTVRALRDGKLRLDVTLTEILPAEIKGDHVRTHSQSVRTIETVKPKEPLELTMGPYTLEVKTQQEN